MVLRELNPSEVYYLLIHKRTVFWTIKILPACQAKGVLENSNYRGFFVCLFVLCHLLTLVGTILLNHEDHCDRK